MSNDYFRILICFENFLSILPLQSCDHIDHTCVTRGIGIIQIQKTKYAQSIFHTRHDNVLSCRKKPTIRSGQRRSLRIISSMDPIPK